MKDVHTLRILTRLYKIVEAGEKGYAVAASNVSNRAIKILFSSYAQQRLDFKEEIFEQMQRLGEENSPRSSILGVIHRGRIDIFATLTIGEENIEKTVLKEVMVGENVALKVYQQTLKENLPPEIKAMVERQARDVRGAVDQIRAMRGLHGKRLLLRLYDSKSDVEQTVRELKEAGFSDEQISISGFSGLTEKDLYQQGRGTTILETGVSGAVGGGVLGTIASLLVVVNMLFVLLLGSSEQPLDPFTFLYTASTLITGGVFVGGVIGLFMGWGISTAHRYVSETIGRGEMLLEATVEEARASRAWKIMYQSAMVARARQAKNAIA